MTFLFVVVIVLLRPAATWINPGTPKNVPESFDCAARKAGLQFGQTLLPERGSFRSLFDALQLQNCGMTPPSKMDSWTPPTLPTPTTGTNIYASPTGSDNNPGTMSQPVRTIRKAVERARGGALPRTVLLRAGTYYSTEVVLTEADSHIRIQNYNGERAVVSGGTNLNLKASDWKAVSSFNGYKVYNGQNNVFGRANSMKNSSSTVFLGKFQTVQDCQNAAAADKHYSFTWHDPKFGEPWATQCFGLKGRSWIPTPETNVYSGVVLNNNIYKADLSSLNLEDIPGLRLNGLRAIRARYPNADPELSGEWYLSTNAAMGGGGYDQGWMPIDGNAWVAPPKGIQATDLIYDGTDWPSVEWPLKEQGGSPWTGEGDWGKYYVGIHGYCKDLTPPAGYWCSNHPPRGNCFGCGAVQTHMSPKGFLYKSGGSGANLPNGPYKNAPGAVMHVWRGGGRWYTWQCLISADDKQNGILNFDPNKGCNQGGEGEIRGSQWWIENVMEELDDDNEWFYDAPTKTLYYSFNGTGPADGQEFVGTSVKEIFRIVGSSQQKPADNITITGLEIRDAALTYLDPHGMPSGGDWAIQRTGAVFMENATNVVVDNNLLVRIDNIAVFISGFTRGVRITSNEIAWVGGTAIASWGYTGHCLNENCTATVEYPVGPDGRAGNQPRGTVISKNLVREVGIWQKQSSFYFQAVTAQTMITNNIHFNGPRAGINFNDGFGGGDTIDRNLLANCVRESGDHGPFNSWDRVPYITTIRTGKASILPADRHITRNFIVSTYNSQEAIDNDDGSAYYNTSNNFFVYPNAGLKSDFGGHNNWQYGNIYGYAGSCVGKGNYDAFFKNVCFLRGPGGYNSDCHLAPGEQVFNNRIGTPSGALNVCGTTWQKWHGQEGHDPQSTLEKTPSDEEIIQMVRKLIGF